MASMGSVAPSPVSSTAPLHTSHPLPSSSSLSSHSPVNDRLSLLSSNRTSSSSSSSSFDHLESTIGNSVVNCVSDKAKKQITSIIENVNALSDVEKVYLYLQLPAGGNIGENSSSSDVLKQKSAGNPFGKKADAEVAQTYTWIQSHLEEDASISLPKHEVYEEYRHFCQLNQIDPLCVADFGKAMKHIFPNVKPRRLGQRGNSRYCYSGLRKKTSIVRPELPDLYSESSNNTGENNTYQVTFRCNHCDRFLIQERPAPPESSSSASSLTVSTCEQLLDDHSSNQMLNTTTTENDRGLQRLCSLIILDWAGKYFNCEFANLRDLAKHLVIHNCVESDTVANLSALCTSQDDLSIDDLSIDSKQSKDDIKKESSFGKLKFFTKDVVQKKKPESSGKKLIKTKKLSFETDINNNDLDSNDCDETLGFADIKVELLDNGMENSCSNGSMEGNSYQNSFSQRYDLNSLDLNSKNRKLNRRNAAVRSNSVIEGNLSSFGSNSHLVGNELDCKGLIDSNNNNLKRRHSTSVLLNGVCSDANLFENSLIFDSINQTGFSKQDGFKKRFVTTGADGLDREFSQSLETIKEDVATDTKPFFGGNEEQISWNGMPSNDSNKINQLRKMLEINLPRTNQVSQGLPSMQNFSSSQCTPNSLSNTCRSDSFECSLDADSCVSKSTNNFGKLDDLVSTTSSGLVMHSQISLDQTICGIGAPNYCNVQTQIPSVPASPGCTQKKPFSFESNNDNPSLSYINYGQGGQNLNNLYIDGQNSVACGPSEPPSPFVSPRSTPVPLSRSRNNSGQNGMFRSLQQSVVPSFGMVDCKFISPQNGCLPSNRLRISQLSCGNNASKPVNRARHSSGPGGHPYSSSIQSTFNPNRNGGMQFQAVDTYRPGLGFMRSNSTNFGPSPLCGSSNGSASPLLQDKIPRPRLGNIKNCSSFSGFHTTPSSPYSEPLSPNCAMFNDGSHSLDTFISNPSDSLTSNDISTTVSNNGLVSPVFRNNSSTNSNVRSRHMSSPYTNPPLTPVTPTSQFDSIMPSLDACKSSSFNSAPGVTLPKMDTFKHSPFQSLESGGSSSQLLPSITANQKMLLDQHHSSNHNFQFPLSPPPSNKLFGEDVHLLSNGNSIHSNNNHSNFVPHSEIVCTSSSSATPVASSVAYSTSSWTNSASIREFGPSLESHFNPMTLALSHAPPIQDDLQATIEDLRDCDNEFSKFAQELDDRMQADSE